MEFDAIRLYKLLSSAANICQIVRKGSFLEKLARREIHPGRIYAIKFSFNPGPSLVKGIRNVIVENDIKNVIYLGASELVSIYLACMNRNVNLIVRHGTTKSHSKKDLYHKIIYSKVDWHVAVSDHILRNVQEIVPISRGTKLRRIYLSRDIDEAPIPRDDTTVRIVHVGRVNPGKGQSDAVVALKKLKDNGIDFEANFLGSIENQGYFDQTKRLLNEYEMGERVHFRGHVSDVIHYLKGADIFLFPSRGEGLPNALIESMALGLVPITYDNTVFPEIRQLGFHIVLANDGDLRHLSDQLYEVATRLPEHREKSKLNAEKYKNFFTPRIEREQYLDVLV